MAQVMFYGTGRRKNAIARVFLVPGDGKVIINDKPIDEYFGRRTLEMVVRQPIELTGIQSRFDIKARVLGGGISHDKQLPALRHRLACVVEQIPEHVGQPVVGLHLDILLRQVLHDREGGRQGRVGQPVFNRRYQRHRTESRSVRLQRGAQFL